jgi:replication factor A2
LVGQIINIQEQATNMTFLIDDGTGKIEVRTWLDPDDQNDYMVINKSTWAEKMYVRVVGNLRSFMNKRSVVAFRIQTINDFDEITFHFLEVLYVHLSFTRSVSSIPVSSTAPSFNNYTNSSNNSYNNFQFGGILNSMIMQVIKSTREPNGVSVGTIAERLGRSNAEIKDALESLSGEGHVYVTNEEDRYQSSDYN